MWDFRQSLMNKPLFLSNNFSCIVKFICLVDRPFLVVSCLKKNKRWDFTEQLWLKIAVRAQGAFFKLWTKSHHFLPKKSESHRPWGGFRFNPIWNLTFFIRLKNKKQKRRLSLFLKKIRIKRQPLQTALFQVNRPFFIVFCLKKTERWDFTRLCG